jgi:hypothetical protein
MFETKINIAAARLRASELHAKYLVGDALRRAYPNISNLFDMTAQDDENFYFICDQLKTRKSVAGEIWNVYNFEVEMDLSTCMVPSKINAPYSCDSNWHKLENNVDTFLRIERLIANGDVRIHVYMRGFRGRCEYSVAMFRFGKGPPKKMVITPTWTRDEGFVLPKFLTSDELHNGGYINEWDNKVHLLVTAAINWGHVAVDK